MKLRIWCGTPLNKFNDWEVAAVYRYVTNKCENWPCAMEVSRLTGVHPFICRWILNVLRRQHRPKDRCLRDYLD